MAVQKRTKAPRASRKRPESKAQLDANAYLTTLRSQYRGQDNVWWLYTVSRGVTGPHTVEDCELFAHNSNGEERIFIVHSKHVSNEPVPWIRIVQSNHAKAPLPARPPPLLSSPILLAQADQRSWWQ
jgi:hypothetical protein